MPLMQRTTRLAPSPTGALHLGNARTFLINWAMARQNAWKIVLRIEDLDSPRVKPWAKQQAVDDLTWLGMDWDTHAGFQLDDLKPYEQALDQLYQQHLVYPCQCTRKEIELAQSAPHGDEHELRYPGTCKPTEMTTLPSRQIDHAAWRVMIPDQCLEYVDGFAQAKAFS